MSQAPNSGLPTPRIESAGLDGWLVRLFPTIEEANLAWLGALARRCETAFGEALIDLVPSYTTLLVVFDPLRLTPESARRRLADLLADLLADPAPEQETEAGELHELLTWYDPSVGPDLERVAQHANMSLEAVIDCHAGQTYRVFALGFAPGFAFMGLLDRRLEVPRLDTPRQRVPVNSVAIAGRQTAAYPAVSPGGWNLLGRTTARLFDRDREGFSLLRVGDRVRFVPVDRATFERHGGDATPMETRPRGAGI
ncbi:5-oxoprolinase subunit B family protein [Halomonas marinisediminis]|uniref:Allophanate hydrolase subunit 1 n=1 Tax=Halomonas marinisediminis TaxID=2546095 RepID=A0ABY2DFK6_9GAMM|nr:allophanate hydrolase subunit 1 [Halomonas marinisediminis]TDB05442.1 allophanate hydrolase subunit 1 [Halomonas marinisediminis]